MMTRILLAALAFSAAPLAAQADATASPPLDLQQQTALRCSAAIAVVSSLQQQGESRATSDYPPIGERGREFFVRSTAKVMEETGMNREQVAAALAGEARELSGPGRLDEVMPACLLMLDASGL